MLTFVPTPIGNLQDITPRILKSIEEAEIVYCEDTRVSKRLIHLLEDKFENTPSKKSIFHCIHIMKMRLLVVLI